MIPLLHWSQISFPGTFFWGLQTTGSCWGPDLENRVDAEAIWSAIHVVLPSLQLTFNMVPCLGERALFSSSFVAVLGQFLPSNAPRMLYNISYGWFFLSQGNQCTKYIVHPKIRSPKPCLLMFVSLVTLDSSHLLLSTQLTANLLPEWSGGSIFHSLSHLHKNSFLLHWNSCKQCSESPLRCCFWSTVSKCCTHFEHSLLIDKCSCRMVNTLPSNIFNSSAISCNFNLWLAKMRWWSFLVFSGTTAEFV